MNEDDFYSILGTDPDILNLIFGVDPAYGIDSSVFSVKVIKNRFAKQRRRDDFSMDFEL